MKKCNCAHCKVYNPKSDLIFQMIGVKIYRKETIKEFLRRFTEKDNLLLVLVMFMIPLANILFLTVTILEYYKDRKDVRIFKCLKEIDIK